MNDFWSLWPGVILGHEGEEAGDPDENPGEEDPNEDPSEDPQEEPKDSGDSDIEKLNKALAAERRNSKRLERELRAEKNAKAAQEQAENDTIEQAKKREADARTRSEKLAAGILKRDIDTAIRRAAADAKFIDVEDAVAGVDRSQIVFDQDDEDPSDIEIDLDTVTKVVKALAAKKSHFLRKPGTDDGEPTGNPHGGSRKRSGQSTEDVLLERYPSL